MKKKHKRPLIHFITNYVTMNDVANTCIAVGGRPIMAEAVDELKDIMIKADGIVLNMGTINQQRMDVIEKAGSIAQKHNKPVLLDPVGCGASKYRLSKSIGLLKKGGITILKCNAIEAKALVSGKIDHEPVGVDGYCDEKIDSTWLGKSLFNVFFHEKDSGVVVITGETDAIISNNQVHLEGGGSSLQEAITGTGCMLNACIMTCVANKPENIFESVVKGVKTMNQSSERAAWRLKNKRYFATYKSLLIDEIAASEKIVYLVTDERLDFEGELIPKVEEALKHGVKVLQYRVKQKAKGVKVKEALALKQLCDIYGATFIINDDVMLAKEVMAGGVHLGNSDMLVEEARKILGEDAVIGATAKTVKQAKEAVAQGVNYLGVGALFPSPTKKEAIRITKDILLEIKKAVSVPIYGIGGITPENLTSDISHLVDGVAVVSCVFKGKLEGRENTIENIVRQLYYNLES